MIPRAGTRIRDPPVHATGSPIHTKLKIVIHTKEDLVENCVGALLAVSVSVSSYELTHVELEDLVFLVVSIHSGTYSFLLPKL